MIIELIALTTGVIVFLACVFGRLMASRGQMVDVWRDDAGTAPSIGVVTEAAFEALPLVAPDRSGYGTASRMLIQAAAQHRTGAKVSVPLQQDRGGSVAA